MPRRGVIVAALLVLVLAGGGTYWSYRGSPTYALRQIESAAQDGNRLRFQQYVDLDRFLPSAVDQLMSQAALEHISDGNASGFGALGAAIDGAMADQLKPALIQSLRSAILDAVEAGTPGRLFASRDTATVTAGAIDVAKIGSSTGMTPDGFAGLGNVRKEGDVALVELRFLQLHLDTTLALLIRMEREGRRWRVVAPENLDSYMRRMEDLQAARLAQLNAEASTEVRKHLQVGEVKRIARRLFTLTSYEFEVPVQNVGTEPLHLRFAWLKAPGASGYGHLLLADRDRLEPGEETILKTSLLEGVSDLDPTYTRGDVSALDLDLSLVLGGENDARYVGTYRSWHEFERRQEDPDGFAQAILAQRVRPGDDDVEDLLGRATTGNWTVNESVNPLDDSPIVTLVGQATEGRSRFGDAPSLVLRCRGNRTEVYINWGEYLGSSGVTVSYRIGDDQLQRRRWSLSTDNRATFYPGSDIQLIRSLAGVDRFVANVTPYGESPVTAVFDLTGLEEHLPKLQSACNWN
jgi:hypothetical protein